MTEIRRDVLFASARRHFVTTLDHESRIWDFPAGNRIAAEEALWEHERKADEHTREPLAADALAALIAELEEQVTRAATGA
jgi:hypothetical protein